MGTGKPDRHPHCRGISSTGGPKNRYCIGTPACRRPTLHSEEGGRIRLGIVEQGNERVQYVSPEAIVSVATSPENLDIINDWLYWPNFELLPG